jgi:serine O-acetyltransferase
MIKNRIDLEYYIKEDSKFYSSPNIWDFMLERPSYMIRKYLLYLRKCEFATNVICVKKGIFKYIGKFLTIYYNFKMRKLSWKLGFQFSCNVFDAGVHITSYGTIIVNPNARIGKNCTIYPGAVVGGKSRSRLDETNYECEAPVVGDNVYIGLGAKIIGNVKVGNYVFIAPNAVVVKDVPDNCVVGGVPAKIIKVFNDQHNQ